MQLRAIEVFLRRIEWRFIRNVARLGVTGVTSKVILSESQSADLRICRDSAQYI